MNAMLLFKVFNGIQLKLIFVLCKEYSVLTAFEQCRVIRFRLDLGVKLEAVYMRYSDCVALAYTFLETCKYLVCNGKFIDRLSKLELLKFCDIRYGN